MTLPIDLLEKNNVRYYRKHRDLIIPLLEKDTTLISEWREITIKVLLGSSIYSYHLCGERISQIVKQCVAKVVRPILDPGSIHNIGLTSRSKNCLMYSFGVRTIKDFLWVMTSNTEESLLTMPLFGEDSLESCRREFNKIKEKAGT